MPKITFAGICTWVDPDGADRYSRVILPNGEGGMFAAARTIPPHIALINAKRDDIRVDLNDWGRDSLAMREEVLLFLKGVDIRFSDTPEGSPRAMRQLTKVRDVCGDADAIRDGFLRNPDPTKVSAIAHVRNGASGVTRHKRARSAFLDVSVGTQITTQPFGGGARRLIDIIKQDAHVIIANVDLTGYLFDLGDSDEHHRLLHCKSFEPRGARRGTERPLPRPEPLRISFDRFDLRPVLDRDLSKSASEEVFFASLAELKRLDPGSKVRLAEKIIELMKLEPDFLGRLDTLGTGCENTTHP